MLLLLLYCIEHVFIEQAISAICHLQLLFPVNCYIIFLMHFNSHVFIIYSLYCTYCINNGGANGYFRKQFVGPKCFGSNVSDKWF